MKKYIILLSVLLTFGACDYLDIVPDERTSEENTYETPQAIKGYLYSCYGYHPHNRDILTNAYHMLGGETTFFRQETFSTFYENTWSPSSLHMTTETWGPIWDGIRRCYQFLSIIDKTENVITPQEIAMYKAEVNFMIAYYHFISLRSYGPTMIIDQLLKDDMPISQFPERSSVDEVVAFIDSKLDEALPELAEEHTGRDYGRVTKYTALALRSRLYLYAASPLFNGQSPTHPGMYQGFNSPIDGRPLISTQYDVKKWEKSASVTLDVITELEKVGFHLYGDAEAGTPDAIKPALKEKAQRRVRYSTMDWQNNLCEVIWADTREEGQYGLQSRSMIRQTQGSNIRDIQGTIVPTLQSVESFYTRNGLPMEYDKGFDYTNRYDVVTMPVNYDGNEYSTTSNGTTCKMHLDREPRFYAFVGFHNGFVEIARYNGQNTNNDNAKKVTILKMRKDDLHGKNERVSNYSVSGYNNKKLCHPAYSDNHTRYPLPLFRIAELYLNYAEALIEIGGAANLEKAKTYIDKIRIRAGLPTVDDAWNNYSTQPGYQNDQAGLREIVRRERMLEFYLEGHKFFDVRRWMIAEKHYGIPDMGLNVTGATDEEFFRPGPIEFLPRSFHKGQYLMPIGVNEINKIPQLIQNPYYN